MLGTSYTWCCEPPEGSCGAVQVVVVSYYVTAVLATICLPVDVSVLRAAALGVLQLEQDLSNPAAPLTAATAYEDVLSMLRNTAIRYAATATTVHPPSTRF